MDYGWRWQLIGIRGETEVLRVVPRGWGCKRRRLVESDSVILFSLFGYVRPVLTRTAPIDLGPIFFSLFDYDRDRKGGGVAIYARNELNAIEIKSLNYSEIENLFIKVHINNTTGIWGVCYRPPNQSANERDAFIDKLSNQFDTICGEHVLPFYLLGDFNDRCIDWKSSHEDSELGLKLVNLLNEYNLKQIINCPTRGSNLLDLIITDNPASVISSGVVDPFDCSLDHCPVYATVRTSFDRLHCYKRKVRHYNANNLAALDSKLKLVPWYAIMLTESDVNDMVQIFYNVVFDELNEIIPELEVTIRPRDRPGMNNEVRKKLNISRKLNKIAKLCNTNEASNAHKLARREAKKAWKKSQKEYFAKLASQISLDKSCNNSKNQWKLLKAMYAADKSSSIPALVTSGVTHNTNQTKGECLNSFFAISN